MSSYKKYTNYKCDVCKRKIQLLVEKNRIDPIRCKITYKCVGKLDKVSVSNTKTNLYLAGENASSDYIQRGKNINTNVINNNDDNQNVFSGSDILTLAAIDDVIGGENQWPYFAVKDLDNNDFLLKLPNSGDPQYDLPDIFGNISGISVTLKFFEIADTFTNYKLYTYTVPQNTQLIQGSNFSNNNQILYFNSSNSLKVFVNGIEIDSTNYDSSINNLIKFTPLLTETSNFVQIYVYNDVNSLVNSSNLKSIIFTEKKTALDTASLSTLNKSAWGDVVKVKIPNKNENWLMFSNNLSELELGKTYILHSAYATSGESQNGVIGNETKRISLDNLHLVFGTNPFSFIDKEQRKSINLKRLADNTGIISYIVSSANETQLNVDKSYVDDYLESIKITKNTSANLINSSNVTSITKKPSNKFILGVS